MHSVVCDSSPSLIIYPSSSAVNNSNTSSHLLFPPEHQSLQQRFDKKERECEAKNKEKDDMMEMLNKMKDKLERESNDHKQAKLQVAELSARLQQLSSVCSLTLHILMCDTEMSCINYIHSNNINNVYLYNTVKSNIRSRHHTDYSYHAHLSLDLQCSRRTPCYF